MNSFYLSQYDLSMAASYEVDLWNKLRSNVRASSRDSLAARAELEAMAHSLSATVADTWFHLIEQRCQVELLDEQLESGRTLLELLELRLGQGVASALDVYQQRQQLASTRAIIPRLHSQMTLLENQLATLLGRVPKSCSFSVPKSLPELPPRPCAGLPIELLQRRPDVRAARQRVFAADSRVASAVAAQFPSLELSGSTGFSSSSAANLFEDFIWSLGSSLLAPILDGGRRRAELRRSRFAVKEKLENYGSTVLTAIREVEDALAREQYQIEYIEELDENLSLAKATLDEAKARYLNGLSDYLPVLTALVNLQNLQRSRVTAQRELLSLRIGLHRALGGTWMRDLDE